MENAINELAKCLDIIKCKLDEIDKRLCKIAKCLVISSMHKPEVNTIDKEDYD